jgi:DNA replication protein DnaC
MSDTPTPTVDTARLPVLLTQLRLPTVALLWPTLTETADRESWPAAKTLAALMEHEVAERARRRTARHLLEARLPAGKTLDLFDFAAVSSISKARITALAEGDSWLDQGTNILMFGPPGVGKSHLAAALGHAMVDAGYRVLFTRTTDLVQQLQAARQELKLATAIEKLDKYHLLVLDDLSYVQKSQAETSVIFELISARYERRSLLITANQPFGAWDSIFPDPAMTVAAIDRLVHHSIILEMNTDSYRRKSAEMKLRRKAPGSAVKGAVPHTRDIVT